MKRKSRKPLILTAVRKTWAIRPTVRVHGSRKGYNRQKFKRWDREWDAL